MTRIDWWRCWAAVGLEMMDPAYAARTPEMPLGLLGENLDGWWGTMAFELVYGAVGE